MPYFFILPGFVLYVLALGVAILFASLYRPAGRFRPCLVSSLIWSSIGLMVSAIGQVARRGRRSIP